MAAPLRRGLKRLKMNRHNGMRSIKPVFIIGCLLTALPLYPQPAHAQSQTATDARKILDQYCVTCHNQRLKTAGLTLDTLDVANPSAAAETWEKAIRKLRIGAMPPQGARRPDKSSLDGLASYLETSLDRAALTKPNPGRATMHRLNRAEYANAIRDLLDLEIDADALLPPDDESSGFDNIADVLRVSPSLMERYLSASWNISRVAVGNLAIAPCHRSLPRSAGSLAGSAH